MSDANAHVGPSDYVPWLQDRKWCYIRMEGTTFGNVPLNCEVKLEVWDSPNSAGVVIDAIRCAKLALDRGIGGALTGPSSYFMKSPPKQFTDNQARELVEAFIHNEEPQPRPESAASTHHDRSNQTVERTEQSVPLGFSDGPEMAGVFRNDNAGGDGDTPDAPHPAAGARRDLAD
jgi:myo-inositol-1-phosphate synthase